MLKGFQSPVVQAEAIVAGGLLLGIGLVAVAVAQSCGRAESTCRSAQSDCHFCVDLAHRVGL